MKQFNYILIIIFLINSCDTNKTADTITSLKDCEHIVQFPIEAKLKNSNNAVEDTFVAELGKLKFKIAQDGKMFWGQNPKDTFNLSAQSIIENAFLYLSGDNLLIFYTESDHDGATSKLVKINLASKKRIFLTEIEGFNLGLPNIVDSFAYVTSIGVVGKLNLKNGQYVYHFLDLYDDKKYSFNSFDTIIIKKNFTFFLSENPNGNRIDSVIVNETTGEIEIRK